MIPEPLRTLLAGPEFRVGLLAGGGALVVGMAVGMAWRAAGRQGVVPVAGLLIAGAGALALHAPVSPAPGGLVADPGLPAGLAIGLAVLACGGLVVDLVRWPRAAAAVLALPGAALVAFRGELVDVVWVRWAVAAVIVLGGVSVASFDARWRNPPVASALLAVSAVGIYFTVPDTEEAMVLLGVVAPMALLGWPLRLGALGTGGSLAAIGLLCWTVAAGGYGRHSSIVGGLACLGLLAIEPVARLTAARSWPTRLPGRDRSAFAAVAIIGCAQLAVVYVASRVAGLRLTVRAAVGIVVVEAVIALWVLTIAARRSSRLPQPEPSRAWK